MISAIAIAAVLARLLSRPDFGGYVLALSIVLVASTIGQLGMRYVVVRFVSESIEEDQPERAAGTIIAATVLVFFLAVLTSVVLVSPWGVTFVRDLLGSRGLASCLLPLSLWVIVSSIAGVQAEVFRAFGRFLPASLFEQACGQLAALALLIGVWLQLGDVTLRAAIWVSALGFLVSVVIAQVLLTRVVGRLTRARPIIPRLTTLLAAGVPIMLTSLLLRVVGSTADLWVISAFRSQSDVATYGAAVRLVQVLAAPFVVATSVVSPFIPALNVRGRLADLSRLLRTTATLALIPVLAGSAAFCVAGAKFLTVLFGGHYASGATVLVILAFGLVANVWAGAGGYVLLLTGHQRAMMCITGATALVGIAVAVFLVQTTLGVVGVALATTGTVIAQNALMLVVIRRRSGIWPVAWMRPSQVMGAIRELAAGVRRAG
jgi:O-antigen/teichoic acid export membrane protein